ncbi:MAG: helix-turn-helix transcriptional regulator [Alphaproteobacteria bacterium]
MDNRQRINTRDAARYLGLSARTLEKLRVTGGGPPYFKALRRVVYEISALDQWLAPRVRRSTSDPAEQSQSA